MMFMMPTRRLRCARYALPVFTAVHRHLLTTHDHGPSTRPVNTGCVYRA